MSEGSTSVSVGFYMSYEDALKPFCFKKEEVSHEEDRFSKKTGEKIGTKKVIDMKGGTYIRLPGVDQEWGPCVFEDESGDGCGSPAEHNTYDFLDALGELLNCQVESFGGYYQFVGFNVALKEDYLDDSYDCSFDFSASGSLRLDKMAEMSHRAELLKQKMIGLGYEDPGLPLVYNACSVEL